MKNLFYNRKGVSEIVGIMLLLGIAVILFSVVYFSLLSTPTPNVSPAIDMIAGIEKKNDNYTITIEHHGGESIDADSHFFVEIAGIKQPEIDLRNLIQDDDSSSWDFGEQIRYNSTENLSGLQVDVGIADVHSNSLLLLSTLQQGYRISQFGWGGIWHFDENGGNKAYDSTGNKNHGSITGENWTNESKSGSALSFNGVESLVTVPDSIGLDIHHNLTMEAWVKPEEVDAFISQENLTSKFAYTPDIVHVADDAYAVVSEKQQKFGEIVIINISKYGDISVSEYNETFGNASGKITMKPEIMHVSNDMYVIGFIESKKDAIIKTVEIYSNSSFDFKDSFQLDPGETCSDLSIEKVEENTFAVTYSITNGSYDDGVIRIINITESGEIVETGSYKIFPSIDWSRPKLYKIQGDIFAITYSEANIDHIKTLNISTNQGIYYVHPDVFTISEGGTSVDPFLIHMQQGLCGVIYGKFSGNDVSNSRGYVKTIKIFENHTVVNTGYEIQLSNHKFHLPDAIKISDNTILTVFSTVKNPKSNTNSKGYFLSIIINGDGSLELGQNPYEFESSRCFHPKIFRRTDTVFGVIYTIDKHSGSIKTIFVESEPEDRYMRVLGKKGSYGFSVNTTTVFATVNGVLFSAPIDDIESDDGWYHVVVTVDQKMLTIYLNNDAAVHPFPHSFGDDFSIAKTNSPLYCGKGFFGIIDEVGVYGRVLSDEEISNHFDSPGSLN